MKITDHEEAMEAIEEVKSYIKGHVSENCTEDEINNLNELQDELRTTARYAGNMMEEIQDAIDEKDSVEEQLEEENKESEEEEVDDTKSST